ncbi:hypothetical protein BN159_0448 [Streptomyces davaonensis JCM 4913]|uniref:Uncharacterized protein n=1 Tax=Streptomyces davaonensis (strain DSM 101723 / JCM 4913 / KCC S-0913 / 768) TaxID=1214101 RepID=K4QVA0_STRDJ|nr:WD40 repeat domain-containing protein [Streptomyces davaonensis]CCK24827.1 hypothetical protein BN159_0448 [Streptomyces davaonensis JCM 4913]
MTSAQPAFDVVTLPIGVYDHFDDVPGAATCAERAAELLAELGGRHVPWSGRPERVTRTEATARLGAWASPPAPRSSALLWMGHGHSDGDAAALAYAETPGAWTDAETPLDLARRIRAEWTHRVGRRGNWAMVVIEACDAPAFVNGLMSAVHGLRPDAIPGELVLVAAGSDGTTHLGAFNEALAATVTSLRMDGPEFEVSELVRRLDNRLRHSTTGGFAVPYKVTARLSLRDAPATGITATADDVERLREILAARPQALRHFDDKARGGDLSEQAWFFTGRQSETCEIAGWLRETETGMLVVTGPAGSGKSALLGHQVVLADDEFREVLVEAGQLEEPDDRELPPCDCFDAVVHLAGLSVAHVIKRLCDAAGVPREGDFTMRTLRAQLLARGERFTVLADALDEAREPAAIASSVLRRIADLPGCRVVVGIRTEESGLGGEPRRNLVTALGSSGDTKVLKVEYVPNDLGRYVRRRLIAARTAGTPGLSDALVDEIAALVRSGGQNFLSARIAVAEIVARPELLRPENTDELRRLAAQHHESTFAAIRARLAHRPLALLHALALGQGRGLPRSGGVWATAATALAEHGPVSENAVTEGDIDDVLHQAGALIMLDAEDGQTVYRLAHRTFQEHFIGAHTSDPAGATPDALVTGGLLRLAAEQVAHPEQFGALTPYLARHLAAHVSVAGAWAELAAAEAVLDRLNPAAVRDQALREAFGRGDLPPAIVGVLSAWRELAALAPGDRAVLRALATTRATGLSTTGQSADGVWQLAWARVSNDALSVSLGTGISGVTSVELPDHGPVLASLGTDGAVQFWSSVSSAEPITDPLTGRSPEYGATSLASFTLPDGRPVLVRLDERAGVQIWDVRNWQRFGRTGAGLTVTSPDGRTAAVCHTALGTIYFALPHTRGLPDLAKHLVDPQFAHRLHAVAVLPCRGGELLLVQDSTGRLWLWSPDNRRVAGPYRTTTFGSEAKLRLGDGRVLVGEVNEGEIRIAADVNTQNRWQRYANNDSTVTLPPWSHEVPECVAAKEKGKNVLLRVADGTTLGHPLPGNEVKDVLPYGAKYLVALQKGANQVHTARLWNAMTGEFAGGGASLGRDVTSFEQCAILGVSPDSLLLSVLDRDSLTLHRLGATDNALEYSRRIGPRRSRKVTAQAPVRLPDGTITLALSHEHAHDSEKHDQMVEIWDTRTNQPLRDPWRRIRFRDDMSVETLMPVTDLAGRILLLVCHRNFRAASAEIWNLNSGRRLGPALEVEAERTYHARPISTHSIRGPEAETVAYRLTAQGPLTSPLTGTCWRVPEDVDRFVRGPDKTLYAVAVGDKSLLLLDARTGEERSRLALGQELRKVTVLGDRLLVGTSHGIVALDLRLPDTGSGPVTEEMPEFEAPRIPIRWSRLAKWIGLTILVMCMIGSFVITRGDSNKEVARDAISGAVPVCTKMYECRIGEDFGPYSFPYAAGNEPRTTTYRVARDHPYFDADLSVQSSGACRSDPYVDYVIESGGHRLTGRLAVDAKRSVGTWLHGDGDRISIRFTLVGQPCDVTFVVTGPRVHRWPLPSWLR